MPESDGAAISVALPEAATTSAMDGNSKAAIAPTAARRVYDTPELFQQITEYLSVKGVCDLLVLEKAFLWRGMQWIGRRGVVDSARHSGEVGPEGVFSGRYEDMTTLYGKTMRASMRTVRLYGTRSVIDRVGSVAAKFREFSPADLTDLSIRFPNVREIKFDLVSDDPGWPQYGTQNVLADTATLHLPTRTFFMSQRVTIPDENTALATTAPHKLGRLSKRWVDDGFKAVYELRLHQWAKAPSITWLDALMRDVASDRFTISLVIRCFDFSERLLKGLADGLQGRHTLPPLRFQVDLECEGRGVRSWPASQKVNSQLKSMLTRAQAVCADICLGPLWPWPGSMADIVAELLEPTTKTTFTDLAHLPKFGPACQSPGSAVGSNDLTGASIHLPPIRRCFEPESRLHSIRVLGPRLRALDISADVWYSVPSEAGYDDWRSTVRLGEMVDLCKDELHSLERLTIHMGVPSSVLQRQLAATSSRPWSGNVHFMQFEITLDTPDAIVPYFAIAKSLACLANATTSIRADVSWPEGYDSYSWTETHAVEERWSFMDTDLEELVHWLLSLPPARQASIRAADFDEIGLHISRRSLCSWRDIQFFEDEPIPLDLQNLADDYRRWSTICEKDKDSAEAQEVAKMKRRFEHVFGGKQGG